MRYKILLVILLLVIVSCSNGLAQCVNGTETDPTAPQPINAGFKTNTFNWRQIPSFPRINKFLDPVSTELANPFYSTADYLKAISGGDESDSKPSDGWQLIKQDFGYAYGSGNWQGPSRLSVTNDHLPDVIYMMLYNKYSGTLRILFTMKRLENYQQTMVRLSLKEANDDSPNQANLKFNGIFNRYNRRETGLDQLTDVTSVTMPAQAPKSDFLFAYADFHLSYDPCICFFESALQVDFQLVRSSTLRLTGRILGQSVDITSENAKVKPDYLTSVWNNGVPNQPYNQQFASIEKLKDKMSKDNPSRFSTAIDILGKIAKAAKLYNGAATAIGIAASGLVTKAAKTTDIFDFLSFVVGGGKASGPSVITADLSAVGIAVDTFEARGNEILVATPGSKNANLMPEYPISDVRGKKPMYPMYNEMPGKFAVIRTPVIEWSDY